MDLAPGIARRCVTRARGAAPIGIVSAALLCGAAGASPPGFDGVSLRIVTLNLRDGIGAPGSSRADDFGDFVTRLDVDGAGPNHGLAPDIVCFQEVDDSNAGLIDLLSYRNTHFPGYKLFVADGDSFNLNATFVRPDITVLESLDLNTPGPRNVMKLEVQVPGAAKPLLVYNAHFKAFGDSSSQATRTQEADAMGDNLYFELNFGGPNFDGEMNLAFVGDLNSDNNLDGTILGLFVVELSPLTLSGARNLIVESIAGRTIGGTQDRTHQSGARLDYICLDDELADVFDTESPFGELSQDEKNQMGFVYFSADDNGLRANGNPLATNSLLTDHFAVVFDVFLPRDPNVPAIDPEDVDADGDTDVEDLYLWESRFALTAPPVPSPAKDVDCNRNVDSLDGAQVRLALRSGELTDIAAP